jgi:hypothetical protein
VTSPEIGPLWPGRIRLPAAPSDALDHLRHAIEMSEEFRDSAKDDSDLDAIRDEPAFKQLISG